MKNTIIFLLLLLGFVYAQNNAMYMQAMGEAMTAMGKAQSLDELKSSANQFGRIADVETQNWIPGYYAVLNQTRAAFSMGEEDGDLDVALDEAQTRLDGLLKIFPNESELWSLQGMVYQARIQKNPMVRGMTYSGKANKAFEKAKILNEDNPRAWLLHAQNIMHTPGFFGGGMDNACPLFSTALEKFNSFQQDTPFYPSWGKGTAEKYAGKCEQGK